MNKRARLHALVSGSVQGVGFRYFAMRQARTLNITGWVRNLNTGRVEVIAEGNRDDLDQFVAGLWRGPDNAHVSLVDELWEKPTGEFASFTIR